VVIALVALTAGASAASTTNYATVFTSFKLKKDSSGGTFKGYIDSPKGKCVKSRTIKLIRKHNGNKDTQGSDKTGNGGKFAIELPKSQIKNGTYYAKAKKKTFDSGQKVCTAHESFSIKIS
jgi:hypothetical protein